MTLLIPKLRRGTFFPDDVIERYCRIDRALVAAAAEMHVMGVSTRKVEAIADKLGAKSMSKSQVSRLCECLDAEADAFRRQRFDGVRFAYLWLDAANVLLEAEASALAYLDFPATHRGRSLCLSIIKWMGILRFGMKTDD